MSFNSLIQIFRDLRKDMKEMVTTLRASNKHFESFNKAIEAMDRLQRTIEKNEENLSRMIDEMTEMNENVKGMLDISKALKE